MKLTVVGGVLVLIVGAFPASGQVPLSHEPVNLTREQPDEAPDRQDGEPVSREKSARPEPEEVIVTAQKRAERLRDVPLSVSVLRGADIDASSLVSVTEALNTVAGVSASVGYQGGTTLTTVRGVGASGPLLSGSSPIAFYLDSVPFGFVTSAIAPDSAAYDLQRIEVLRGPQGTLFGANAQNGVVRILSSDANLNAFEFKARVTDSSTSGGSNNYRGDAAVNVPIIEGKLGARAVVGYSALSGWVDGPVGNNVNDATLRTYRLKINAQPTDELAIGLSAWSSRNNYGAPSASANNGRISATLPQPMSADYQTYGLNIDYQLPQFSISSRTSYLEYSNRSIWDLIAAGLPNTSFSTDLDSNVFAQEVVLTAARGSSWQWAAGATYRNASDGLLQTSVILPAPLDYAFGSRSCAAFAEVGRRFLHDRFEWSLGLRYFHDDVLNKENQQDQGLPDVPLYHSTQSFESTTPRAVLKWHPGRNVMVYGSYAEGFRSGFPQNASVVQVVPGFPPMKPDKLHNFEIGAKGDLSDRLSFDAALYYMHWDDVQQALSVPFNGIPVTANVNGESASGIGLDIGVAARPLDGLHLNVALSWNDLSLDSAVYVPAGLLFAKGDRLNYSPEITGGASIDYRRPFGSSGLSGEFAISANYSSQQDYRGTNTGIAVIHGDALLIARTSFSLNASHGWTITVFADNIANERGATPTVNLVPEWQLRVRPRTIGAQLDYSF